MLTFNDEVKPFEFQVGETVYSVPQAKSMSPDELLDFCDAMEAGNVAATRWCIEFFERHAEGSTKRLTVEQLTKLFGEWRKTERLGE